MNDYFHRGVGSKREYNKLHAGLLFKIFRTPNFWTELEWMPDGKKLFSAIKKQFKSNQIGILTAPMPEDARCEPGKWHWIEKNLGRIISRDRFFCDLHKERYINSIPGNLQILIDDRMKNIEAWRKVGGIAIHHKNATTTLHELETIINKG